MKKIIFFITLIVVFSSLSFAQDTTPPSASGNVRDGTGADISFTYSTTTLSANWDASTDPESMIKWYWYTIGTAPGTTDILNWTKGGYIYLISNFGIVYGPYTSVTQGGLALAIGTTYYFSVKAENESGLLSQASNSDGQYINGGTPPLDTTPPSAPVVVRDGTSTTADIMYSSSSSQLNANWDACGDPESEIAKYWYAIGITQGGTDIINWTDNGTNLSAPRTGLNLTNGTTYFFSVKAENGAGLQSAVASSNGQMVDTTLPSMPSVVRDGTGADISFTYSTFSLSANWDVSIDTESGISQYDCGIGTTPGGTNVLNWTSVSVSTWVTRSNLALTIGTTYYFGVRAVNGQGLTGNPTNSDGQYIVKIDTTDTTPPSAPAQVRDGTGADIDWVDVTMPMLPCNYCESCLNGGYMSMSLSANWDASTDLESGIAKYWYALGTTAGGTDIVGWTDKGTALTAYYNSGYLLTKGTTYYFSVKAENGAGLQSAITSSNGQYVIKNDYNPRYPFGATPNPFSLSKDIFVLFTLYGWEGGELKIYTINSSLVRKITVPPSEYEIFWDGKNEDGQKVVRGIYIYTITQPNRTKITGKIGVIR